MIYVSPDRLFIKLIGRPWVSPANYAARVFDRKTKAVGVTVKRRPDLFSEFVDRATDSETAMLKEAEIISMNYNRANPLLIQTEGLILLGATFRNPRAIKLIIESAKLLAGDDRSKMAPWLKMASGMGGFASQNFEPQDHALRH